MFPVGMYAACSSSPHGRSAPAGSRTTRGSGHGCRSPSGVLQAIGLARRPPRVCLGRALRRAAPRGLPASENIRSASVRGACRRCGQTPSACPSSTKRPQARHTLPSRDTADDRRPPPSSHRRRRDGSERPVERDVRPKADHRLQAQHTTNYLIPKTSRVIWPDVSAAWNRQVQRPVAPEMDGVQRKPGRRRASRCRSRRCASRWRRGSDSRSGRERRAPAGCRTRSPWSCR